MAKSKSSTSAAKKRSVARHPQSHTSDSASTTHGKAAKRVAGTKNISYNIREQHQRIQEAFSASSSGIIDTDDTDKALASAGFTEWLSKLDQFAKLHPGEPVSDYARANMPPALVAVLSRDQRPPKFDGKAPAIWPQDKLDSDTPITFTMRHYGKYMSHNGDGITQAEVRRVNFQLVKDLSNYLRHHADELPPDYFLPTKKIRNDLWIKRLGLVDEPLAAPHDVREMSRLFSALRRRKGAKEIG